MGIQENVNRHAVSDMANVPNASQARIVEIRAESSAPSTSSVLWAAWRQGLKDLQTAVLGNLGGTHEEPGTIANPTQIEVTQDRQQESNHHELVSYEHGLATSPGRARDQDRGIER